MDNVTHALAGMLMADAAVAYAAGSSERTMPARFKTGAVVLGIAAAEFPDTDLVYSGPLVGMGKLGYLLHHRGHTHTIVWAVVSAVVLWMIARWWWNRSASPSDSAWWTAHGGRTLLALALAGTLSHLVLDWTNSYGVHPFWPFDNRWYYGDAVFIVEPWLWVVAIPPLFWNRPSRKTRAVLLVLLLLILSASWGLGEVARPVALLLTGFVAIWMVVQRVLPRGGRLLSALMAWMSVTSTFFLGASQARAMVRDSMRRGPLSGSTVDSARMESRPQTVDIVLNPAAGDPTCWLAMTATSDGATYRVSEGLVAPFPGVRSAAQCAEVYRAARVASGVLAPLPGAVSTVPFATSSRLQWRASWTAPIDAFITLATERCEFAAALRFMRLPVWTSRRDGRLQLSDARYGVSGDGFAELVLEPSAAPCSLSSRSWVPGWVPPRDDVLRSNR